MSETSTGTVAVGAISSPLWLQYLSEASSVAGTFLPILGAVWLLVQIVRAVWSWPKKN